MLSSGNWRKDEKIVTTSEAVEEDMVFITTTSNNLSIEDEEDENNFQEDEEDENEIELSKIEEELKKEEEENEEEVEVKSNKKKEEKELKCNTKWIENFLIATFDIELGQKIQQVYPSEHNLTHQQLMDIAYLSFPDGNNQTSTFGGATSDKPSTSTWAFRTSDDLFGYVYFMQQQDPNVKRGFVMTSIIITSKLPFIKLFRYMVQRIALIYFKQVEKIKLEKSNERSSSSIPINGNFVFEKAMLQVNSWEYPKVDFPFELSFFGQKIKYRSPIYLPQTVSHQGIVGNNNININREDNNLKERLLGRKYPFQQEVNIYRNFINHSIENLIKYWELVLTGEPLLILSPTPTQCCVSIFSLVSLIAPIPYGGDIRPYFTVHNQDFKYFSQMGGHHGFTSAMIGVTNPFFIKAYENWPHIITVGKQLQSMKKNGALPNNNGNSSSIMSTSPMSSIVSGNKLISFFTNIDNDTNERKQLMWEYKETFLSKKKNFIINVDFSNLKLLTDDIDATNQNSADTINNDQIRKFFEELTETFLHPVHQCFDTLICSMTTFIIRSEHSKVFKPEKFVNYVKKFGYNEKIFKGKKSSDVFELYKRFIYSANFKCFMENRLREAYVNDVKHTDIEELLKDGKITEINLIDLFLQVKQDLLDELRTYYDQEVISRLQLFLKQILSRLPDSLKTHLERQLQNIMLEN
ncbi:hypothetical protein ABK040_016195 [Willaertia magna]